MTLNELEKQWFEVAEELMEFEKQHTTEIDGKLALLFDVPTTYIKWSEYNAKLSEIYDKIIEEREKEKK